MSMGGERLFSYVYGYDFFADHLGINKCLSFIIHLLYLDKLIFAILIAKKLDLNDLKNANKDVNA